MNKNVKIILNFMKPQYKYYFTVVLFVFISSIISSIIPILIKNIYDNLTYINKDKVIKSFLLYSFIIMISVVIKNKSSYYFSIANIKTIKNIRHTVIKKLFLFDYNFSTKYSSGDITNRIINEINFIEQYTTTVLFSLITDIFISIIVMLFLLKNYFYVFLFILIVSPIIYITQEKLSNNVKKLTKESRVKFQELVNTINEIVFSLQSILSLNIGKYFEKKYIEHQDIENKASLNMTKESLKANMIQKFYVNIIQLSILIYGIYSILNNKMTLGTLISLNMYVGYIISPIDRLAKNKIQIKQLYIYIERLFEIINFNTNEDIEINEISEIKSIHFNNLRFKYNSYEEYTLDNINFTINKGEKIAIIGKSGSGKSTIVKLLFKMLNVDNDMIYINDLDINTINKDSLRNNISYIFQDNCIFRGNVLNNILFDNKLDNDKLNRIIDEIGLKDLIQDLNIELSENGKNLSGGQKQCIALVRALYNISDFIILDEAFASIDVLNQNRINNYLRNEFKNKTVITITHKINLLKEYDKIIIMDNGVIRDIGSHNYLVKNSEYYKSFLENEGA